MIEQNTFNIVFGIFVLLTCRDIFSTGSQAEPETVVDNIASQLDPGHPSLANGPTMNTAPTIKVLYCHSCGYRQAFDEFARILQTQYPEIKVEGANYQPSWFKYQIVNLVFISKIALLAMIYMDINPFNYLQMNTPGFWTYMTQSKMTTSLMILFMANSIESNMMSSGAFEIFYNDMPIWSKIQTGRVPTAPELLQIVGSHRTINKPVRDFVHSSMM